jgi:hypothetical protein
MSGMFIVSREREQSFTIKEFLNGVGYQKTIENIQYSPKETIQTILIFQFKKRFLFPLSTCFLLLSI